MKKPTTIIILSLALFGCASQRQNREIGRMNNYAIKYPERFRKLSNLLNPCFNGSVKTGTTTRIDTVETPGKTDTVRHDSLITITIKTPCKCFNKITEIHDTIPDTRLAAVKDDIIRAQRDSLTILKTQLSSTKEDKKSWMWVAIISILVSIIWVWLWFKGGGFLSFIKNIFK